MHINYYSLFTTTDHVKPDNFLHCLDAGTAENQYSKQNIYSTVNTDGTNNVSHVRNTKVTNHYDA